MLPVKNLLIVLGFISCCLQTQGADKYTDENRPYEFGFKIDGEQHRHEKKDENGIIMGEFGFITADGVYHVTVYATDENGNFKILSMKNLRVKPYPTNPGAEKKGHSLPFPPSQNPPQIQGPNAVQQPGPASPAKTCSSCSIPLPRQEPQLTDYAVVTQNQQQQSNNPSVNSPYGTDRTQFEGVPGSQVYPTGQQNNPSYPQNGQQDSPTYPQQGQNSPQHTQQGNPNYPQQSQSGAGAFGQPPAVNYPQQDLFPPQQGFGGPADQYSEQSPGSPGDRNPKRIDNYPQQSPVGNFGPQGPLPQNPMLITAQMQIVDKNTDIYHKNPGEKDGLPQGLTKNDMVQLLYTFNYTVGFHAHFEEGYSDGSKQGYYYVTGRNGVRTRVDYVADEKGFRPKITEEVLDLLSDDVPKPETEKDDKFGLKGYEFKWLYYPEEPKGR